MENRKQSSTTHRTDQIAKAASTPSYVHFVPGGSQTRQTNQPYPQQQQQQLVGGYQTAGGSTTSDFTTVRPTNHAPMYFNPDDYQTPGGAGAAGAYFNQNWQQVIYVNYGTAPTQQYSQSYNQWADYYSQTDYSVPGAYVASNTQQPATTVQHGAAISNVQDGYWKHGTPTFQTQNVGNVQSIVRTPLDSNHTYAVNQEQHKPVHPQAGYQEQHKPVHPQVSGAQYPATHQLPYNYYTSLQTVSQTVQQTVSQSVQETASENIPFDSRVSKMQIPTNPRIATNLISGLSKIDKDNSVSSAAAKPLNVSGAPPKTNSEVTSHVGADTILKPSMFPKSLHGYVERALSHCKDDKQIAACQEVMKKVITKATDDGVLYTRNWDMEPLFPLPSADAVNNEYANFMPTFVYDYVCVS